MAVPQGSGPRRVTVPETPASVHPLAPATPRTVEERRKMAEEEMGMWEATDLIRTPHGVNAFDVGHRVPKTHVERFPDWLIEGVNIRRITQEG